MAQRGKFAHGLFGIDFEMLVQWRANTIPIPLAMPTIDDIVDSYARAWLPFLWASPAQRGRQAGQRPKRGPSPLDCATIAYRVVVTNVDPQARTITVSREEGLQSPQPAK